MVVAHTSSPTQNILNRKKDKQLKERNALDKDSEDISIQDETRQQIILLVRSVRARSPQTGRLTF